MNDERETSYVLNDYLTFEKKLYVIGKYPLPRPIAFKTMLYFLGFIAVLFLGGNIPIIGIVFDNIRLVVKIAIAGGAAWYLTAVGTEERSPISFFISYLKYNFATPANVEYYQGRELPAPKNVEFAENGFVLEEEPEPEQEWVTLVSMKGADQIEQNHRYAHQVD